MPPRNGELPVNFPETAELIACDIVRVNESLQFYGIQIHHDIIMGLENRYFDQHTIQYWHNSWLKPRRRLASPAKSSRKF